MTESEVRENIEHLGEVFYQELKNLITHLDERSERAKSRLLFAGVLAVTGAACAELVVENRESLDVALKVVTETMRAATLSQWGLTEELND